MRANLVWLASLSFLGVALLASPAQAEDKVKLTPTQLREASEILGNTWSPFCPGRTLSSCSSGKAGEWREDVRAWLAQGMTREQILDRLQARVPGFTLDTIPETGGTRYGPWVLGGVFLLALGALGIVHARRGQRDRASAEDEASGVDRTDDRQRLHAELEALES